MPDRCFHGFKRSYSDVAVGGYAICAYSDYAGGDIRRFYPMDEGMHGLPAQKHLIDRKSGDEGSAFGGLGRVVKAYDEGVPRDGDMQFIQRFAHAAGDEVVWADEALGSVLELEYLAF